MGSAVGRGGQCFQVNVASWRRFLKPTVADPPIGDAHIVVRVGRSGSGAAEAGAARAGKSGALRGHDVFSSIRIVIIWRGWGILALFVTLAWSGVIGGPREARRGRDGVGSLGVGLGLVAAGAGNFFLGKWLNESRPLNQVGEHKEKLRTELRQRAAVGQFQAAPGVPVPTNPYEAEAQINAVVEAQTQNIASRLRNIHTLFFIPIQWVGVLEGVGGVVLMGLIAFEGVGGV